MTAPPVKSKETTRTDLRVVLLVDPAALRCYGPVLRRMAVGLFDEVSDLSLLCLGESPLLDHVPSPPIRLITERRGCLEAVGQVDALARQITINAPRLALVDKVVPGYQLKRIVNVLKPFKPTLIHALSERQAALARRISKTMQIPYVVSLLAMQDPHVPLSRTRCGGVFCCNSVVARAEREREPALASRVHLLPIGTHVTGEPHCFNHPHVAQLVCCCPVELGHGLGELITAMEVLVQRGHAVHLMISGQGRAEHLFRRQIRQLNLVGHVHFVPPIERTVPTSDSYKAILQNADIYVHPWPAPTWQPGLLEAMSVGNAVVSAGGSENDLILPGRTACDVPFPDPAALANALQDLLTDHDRARQLGINAQAYLRKHFLASRMIARLAHVYHECLAKQNGI